MLPSACAEVDTGNAYAEWFEPKLYRSGEHESLPSRDHPAIVSNGWGDVLLAVPAQAFGEFDTLSDRPVKRNRREL